MGSKHCIVRGLTLLVLSAVVLCSAVQAQNNCDNPLFTGVESIKSVLRSSPTATPDGFNAICPNIPQDGQSCCGQESSNGFQNAFNALRSEVQETSDELARQSEEYGNQRGMIEDIDWDMLYNSFKEMNPDLQRDAFFSALNKMLDGIDTFFNNFGGNYGQCLGGVLRYMAGMYCLACDPNWDSFVSGIAPNLSIQLKSATCSALQNDCRPMFDTLQTLLAAATEFASLLGDNVEVTMDSICGNKDCNDFICQDMISGLSYSLPTNINNDGGSGGLELPPVLEKFMSKAMRIPVRMQLRNSIRAEAKPMSVSIMSTSNQFSDNGYDAHNVGSSASPSVFDTTTTSFTQGFGGGGSGGGGSSSSLSGGAIAGIVIGVVVAVAAIVVIVLFLVMRSKRQSGKASRVQPSGEHSSDVEQGQEPVAAQQQRERSDDESRAFTAASP